MILENRLRFKASGGLREEIIFSVFKKISLLGWYTFGSQTNLEQPKYIFSATTKRHFRDPSTKIDVIQCYEKIYELILKFNIKNIGIPPLGCGCGGLYWGNIKPNVENILGKECNCDIYHYLPIKENIWQFFFQLLLNYIQQYQL